jgi:hypothetical protein
MQGYPEKSMKIKERGKAKWVGREELARELLLIFPDPGGENACLPESISRPYARVPYYIYAGISRDVYENKGT